MKRLAVLLLAFTGMFQSERAAPAGNPPQPEYVQAVEFPYYLYPPALWERELVWLKNIGVTTVEFAVPWNWHQLRPGDFDFTGRTSPRRDLMGFVRLLRRLGLRAWVRPLPPVMEWLNNGWPAGISNASNPRAQQAWLKALADTLAAQTASHGGPVAYVEGAALAIDAAAPPAPVRVVSANDPAAFGRSREAIASARGALLWTGVEDSLYPAGWEKDSGSLLHKGAVGLAGDERGAASGLRRDGALLHNWAPLVAGLQPVAMPKPAAGKLPDGITAAEGESAATSAVCIMNRSGQPFHDDLRVFEPFSKRTLVIPGVTVPPGESLWLPVSASIGPKGLCHECTNFAGEERIVYATAELLSIEYENGILAMEFAAPAEGEVILQLAREPVGPFLAAGKPTKFDWDDKSFRARLAIPKSDAPGYRVRIGIAIEEPETSAFFNEAKRLIVGAKNDVSTMYSSAEVAKRSRLRLPEGFSAAATVKSPNEIDYEVSVPADALHGDFANLALEADGMPLGRAHLQLFRPASIRLMQAMQIHIGQQTELTPEPPTASIEPRAGTNIELSIRNNYPAIQTYKLEPAGDGLEFFPPKTEIVIGAMAERRVSFRVFGAGGLTGVRDWRLRVTGGQKADLPMRAILLPRGRTAAWTADLDGDGSPEWVLESPKARAVFSGQDGGRWMEFNWKDANVNFLPEQGAYAAAGAVEVRANGDALEFVGKSWKRTVRLVDATLTIEQSTPLPPDGLAESKQSNVTMSIARTPGRVTYSLH